MDLSSLDSKKVLTKLEGTINKEQYQFIVGTIETHGTLKATEGINLTRVI